MIFYNLYIYIICTIYVWTIIIQRNEGIIFTEIRFSLGYLQTNCFGLTSRLKCFEQIVFNQVTAAIHMTHFVKNLGDKLVDIRSVGQNKVCLENNRSHKQTNAGTDKNHPKQILATSYNSSLDLLHSSSCWCCAWKWKWSIYILQFFKSVCFCSKILFNHVHAHFSWSFVFTCIISKNFDLTVPWFYICKTCFSWKGAVSVGGASWLPHPPTAALPFGYITSSTRTRRGGSCLKDDI